MTFKVVIPLTHMADRFVLEPVLTGPVSRANPGGKADFLVYTWKVVAKNGMLYTVSYETDPAGHPADNANLMIEAHDWLVRMATHHPTAPKDCTCTICIFLLTQKPGARGDS